MKVTMAEFMTQKPPLITVTENPAVDDTQPESHIWPAIVREWNFVEDVLLWKQKYQNSLSQTVPNLAFPNLQQCFQEDLDVHQWWHAMVALPLNLILQNGVEAVMSPLEDDLTPDFGFLHDGKLKLVGEIRCPWHQLASGPATAPDFMEQESKTRQALAQLYGYMELNNCRYGVLTTYSYTWFVKRTGVMGELLISPPVTSDSDLPTLFECYYFLVCEMEQSGFHYDRSAENSERGLVHPLK